MTIEALNAIKTEATAVQNRYHTLNEAVNDAELAGHTIPVEVDTALGDIQVSLNTILTWVNQAIADNTTEEPVISAMSAFLQEIKAVFEKYSAVLAAVDGTAYGDSYGGADLIRFTVTDPSTGQVTTKEFIKTSLTAVDLV